MPDFDAMRAHMVEGQVRPNKVTDPRLIEALSVTPRERFVPPARRCIAYVDEDLEIAPGRYLMEPAVFARLVEAATVTAADTVLDVGCASGYSTAVLGRLAGTVIGLESDRELLAIATEALAELGIDNAVAVEGPLADGYPAQAPYDVIVLEGAVELVPEGLTDQLADGGRLLAVVANSHLSGRRHIGRATLCVRVGDAVSARPLFDAALPLLAGFERQTRFVF
jgi:protein-L-isoaspartate(D-aspartate) O-methyltransferase